MKRSLSFLFLFVLVLSLNLISAVDDFDVAISNSEDWEDVYSTLVFANLNDAEAEFLVSTQHGSVLLNGISRSKNMLLVSSEDRPYVFNYDRTIEDEDFAGVEEVEVDSAVLDLIEEMPEISNFVVVGNDYGYNAIAVAPYAKLTDSWVFLADRANIDEISVILEDRQVDDVLVYGYVDREVREALEQYNPEFVSTGDKFEDNILMVEKFLEISPTQQVVLTNGEFIEKEVMLGNNPVLFTGRENVPDQIADYLKESDIEIGVLIGNELVGAATNIKRSTGINVIAKFARGSRSANSGIATVEGLDLFYLPSPRLELEIYSIKYNRATGQLEVTYKSSSNVPAYMKGTIEIETGQGTIRLGDQDPIFIAPGDFKTIVYDDVELLEEDELAANVYTLFGEVESSLDRILEGDFEISSINVLDSCELEITGLSYNKQSETFYLKLKNLGDVDCWVDAELRDVLINNVETTLGSEESILIKAGKRASLEIEQRMDDSDLEDNEFIEAYVYFGERQESLVKLIRGTFEVDVNSYTAATVVVVSLILIIITLIILTIIMKRRDDDF